MSWRDYWEIKMAKVTIDINGVKNGLENIGYIVSDFEERDNNGKNWQFKFSNSGASVTVYDTNNKHNSVVNGKCETDEKEKLKVIIDKLKCKELEIDTLNKEIVTLINSKHEGAYYDFKKEWNKDKKEDLLHDILCLSNNVERKDAYLIVGVQDDYNVVGVDDWKKSNEIYDFICNVKFAGDNRPDVELKQIYYMYHKVDVLVCKKSDKCPFFLKEPYNNKVFPYIYTRTGDKNTPKNQNANYADIMRLWKYNIELSMKGTN